MIPFNPLIAAMLFSLALSLTCSLPLAAQSPADEESSTNSRANQLYKGFEKTAASLDFETGANGESYKFDPQPLFRFASEGTVFGTVHIWKDASSRLAVIGTIGSIPISNQDYEFVELHLLRPELISPITIPGRPIKTWDPKVESLQFQTLANAPPVAPTDRRRLVQMRGIARQFTAEMTNKGSVNQLRLLPEPLFRYSDSTPEKDGALFAFVWDKGTDPELLLRIETNKTDKGLTWHYQSVRFTYRALELKYNGTKVWDVDEFVERDSPNQNTPYLTGLTKAID